MDDITRERVWRKLLVLPDQQLYQVLDYIEFLEGKYARGKAPEPSGLQRFAERLQDRLRGRSVAPEYISGAVGVLGIARKVVETGRDVVSGVVQTGLGVVDEVVEAGKDLLSEPPANPGGASLPPGAPSAGASATGAVGEPAAGPAPSTPSRPEANAGTPPGADAAPGGTEGVDAPPLTPHEPPPGRDALAGDEP
jgi:hypothetical protein